MSNKRGRKPTRNPLAEENQNLNAGMVRLYRRLKQAEFIIEIQERVSALLGITLPEISRIESNS